MVVTQTVLQWQCMKQTLMHLVAVQKVVFAVSPPMDGYQLPVRAQRIRESTREHGKRLHVEVITDLTQHDQIERPPVDVLVEITSQVAAFDSHVVQTSTAPARLLNRGH